MEMAHRSGCTHHPRAPVGWHCEVCSADLCVDCVGLLAAGYGTVPGCVRCRQIVQPLTQHRSARPLSARIPQALTAVFSHDGLILLSALAVGTFLLRLGGGLGFLVAFGAQWAVAFGVLRKTAAGSPPFATPDFTDIFADLMVPAFRAAVASALPLVPLILYLRAMPASEAAWGAPIAWVLLLLGAAYLPMALLIAASNTSIFHLVNPLAIVGNIGRLGQVYWLTAALCAGLTLAERVLEVLLVALGFGVIPVFIGVFVTVVSCYFTLTTMHLLGLLLFVYGDRVGYGISSEYVEPLNVGPPRGDVAASPAPEPMHQRSFEAIELDSAEKEVADALAARDVDRALETYRRGGVDLEQLGWEKALQLGQGAAGKGEVQLALEILALIRSPMAGEVAARALVISGRLYAERLHDAGKARNIYRQVVEQFPVGPASEFATARLKELPGSDFLAEPVDPSEADR